MIVLALGLDLAQCLEFELDLLSSLQIRTPPQVGIGEKSCRRAQEAYDRNPAIADRSEEEEVREGGVVPFLFFFNIFSFFFIFHDFHFFVILFFFIFLCFSYFPPPSSSLPLPP